MFTIQYVAVNGESKMQDFDSTSRSKLVIHLASFPRPITAVFEQSTVITNSVRRELAEWPGTKSRDAQDFADAALISATPGHVCK